MEPNGNPAGRWGKYEWVKTLNWKTLMVAIAVSMFTWVGAEVVPKMEEQGGTWAAVAFVLVPVLQAVRMLIADNSQKTL